ncbi:MAG: alanine racemase [Rickettsiales bacterium]
MRTNPNSVLEIKLDRIRDNYLHIKSKLEPQTKCSVVVKANAYGLGMNKVAQALVDAKCQEFCVAYLDEGLELRKVAPDASIRLFNGFQKEELTELVHGGFVPVLNDFYQIKLLNEKAKKIGKKLKGIIQLDTGMGRLGLDRFQMKRLIENPDLFSHIKVEYIMSHLACADDALHPLSLKQLNLFNKRAQNFPNTKMTLANSAGVMLGQKYHFDMVRPGCAIYGINPIPSWANEFKQVVELKGRVVQVRHVKKDMNISYHCQHTARKGDVIATVLCGYADGYMRYLTNNSFAYYKGIRLPIVGTVTMDMIMVDVTQVPENDLAEMKFLELIGDNITVDEVAARARTIGYEVFTRLGNRFERIYSDESSSNNW